MQMTNLRKLFSCLLLNEWVGEEIHDDKPLRLEWLISLGQILHHSKARWFVEKINRFMWHFFSHIIKTALTVNFETEFTCLAIPVNFHATEKIYSKMNQIKFVKDSF